MRHREKLGDIVPIPLRAPSEVPDVPKHLGPAGIQLWHELWTHMVGIHERDRSLVEQVCEGADQQRAAYQDWVNSRTIRNGKVTGPANPQLARVLADLRKGWRQDMALLGMTAKDRQAMSKRAVETSSLEQLKRKVIELRRPS